MFGYVETVQMQLGMFYSHKILKAPGLKGKSKYNINICVL